MVLDNDYSLREKKFAKTKVALAGEFIRRMKESRFVDISIKEVCETVEVSEATFYNYFPTKQDIVFYHKALMSLGLQWKLKQMGDCDPITLINAVFDIMGEDISNRNLFSEFICIMVIEGDCNDHKDMEMTEAEKFFAFPNCDGIENCDLIFMDDLLLGLIEQAKEKQLVKANTNSKDVLVALFSIMVGPPLALEPEEYNNFKQHQKILLEWLWKAIT